MKNFKIYLVFLILSKTFCQISSQPSPFGFKNQFIGNTRYVKPEEEQNRSFCNNYWCTNDAHYLFTKSSQYSNIDPCVDFKNFTIDQIVQVDVPDDRQISRGFTSVIEKTYLERMRKTVAAKFDPIKDENSRVIKIIKNTFNQCLKSKHTLRHIQAHKDIVDYLQSLGGSPYLSKHIHFNHDKFNEATDYGIDDLWTNNVPNSFNEDELWTGENFNVSKYFEDEPKHALSLFFDLEISRCKNDKICLKKSNIWKANKEKEFEFESYKELLRTLDDAFVMRPQLRKILVKQLYKPAVERMRRFVGLRTDLWNEFKLGDFMRVKIKDLQKLSTESFKINWLNVINSELFEESKLTENDEIFIEGNLELLQKLMELFTKASKKTISDTFIITFIYWHRFEIILRFHNEQNLKSRGLKHGAQRWVTCSFYNFRKFLQPALLVMYEQRRAIWDRTLGDFDRDLSDERIDIVGSAEKMITEAVDVFKKNFLKETSGKLSIEVSAEILFKLKSLKILIGLQKSIFPISKLEEFYKNLNLTGNENFMKSYWEIDRHHRRLKNEPKTSWRRQIDQVVDTGDFWAKYSVEDGNILYFSPGFIIYPHYHPLRPMFFNMATLFSNTLTVLYKGIVSYKKVNLNPNKDVETGFQYYKNWLKNHTELQIGANYLTNEQLFWVAYAVKVFKKFHRTVPRTTHEGNRLRQEYMHVYFKRLKGFQEAFKCNVTEAENEKFDEFLEKFRELQNRNR
ncbi:hypothetical protein PVAND_017361 [Polypedilum vanderplanki]|uniref:Uncharacterized protein n=1 Tax=Polypedilum vanderplanki TaxID=319348 RepID=A0A9J6BID3_POLVA|nr:hypothetical protein PVAND_017361 [Polypedilum vanderplanki]